MPYSIFRTTRGLVSPDLDWTPLDMIESGISNKREAIDTARILSHDDHYSRYYVKEGERIFARAYKGKVSHFSQD